MEDKPVEPMSQQEVYHELVREGGILDKCATHFNVRFADINGTRKIRMDVYAESIARELFGAYRDQQMRPETAQQADAVAAETPTPDNTKVN